MPALSILLGFAFIIGSTGYTIIIHNCTACGDHSVISGIFLSPEEPEDHCCDAAENHCTPDASISFEGACCHFTIESLKVTNNYTPAVPEPVSEPAVLYTVFFIPVNIQDKNSSIIKAGLHNKHGGRYVSILDCQILS
jgi:hypothetical protein